MGDALEGRGRRGAVWLCAVAVVSLAPAACASPEGPASFAGSTTTAGVATAWEPGDDVESSWGGSGDGELPPDCACVPGTFVDCASSSSENLCADDCNGTTKAGCKPSETCGDNGCEAIGCIPGEVICDDDGSIRTCMDDGSGFGAAVACSDTEACAAGECMAACDAAAAEPSSLGCSFFALKMDTYFGGGVDGVVVANPSQTAAATVQLWKSNADGSESSEGGAVTVAPGSRVVLPLDADSIESQSRLRAGESFRIASDLPVAAYQHAPVESNFTNDGSTLLPESSLGQTYVVASYPGTEAYGGHLAYFDVMAVHDSTTVTWTPPVATLGGDGVPAAGAGEAQSLMLDRHQTLQVAAAFGDDLTGTVVEADGPVWVVGASACAGVPQDSGTCDHIQEQMIPVEHWGQTYVAAHAPSRGGEAYHWRILGGADGVTVVTEPDQTGGPIGLDRGGWIEVVSHESFVIESDGPVLAVQYLESKDEGADIGDPSMIQFAPAEQFRRSYAYATGEGYGSDYVQIIRTAGGADVTIDGQPVDSFEVVGSFEVAQRIVSAGSHRVRSDSPFGLIGYGYSGFASYGYSAGMNLATLNP